MTINSSKSEITRLDGPVFCIIKYTNIERSSAQHWLVCKPINVSAVNIMRNNKCIAGPIAAITFIMLTSCASDTPAPAVQESTTTRETYTSLSDLKGKRIGVQPGTNLDKLILENIEDAQFRNYETYKELTEALISNKIDAFPGDDAVIYSIVEQNEHVRTIPEYLEKFEFGFVFPKTEEGDKLAEQMNEYLKTASEDNYLISVRNKWTGSDESVKTIKDYTAPPGTNGTLKFITEGDYEPFTYFKDGQLVGIDIDIAVGFCEKYGYGMEIDAESFSQIIPDIQESKYDFGAAGISITTERKELVTFSDPYYEGGTALAVYKP